MTPAFSARCAASYARTRSHLSSALAGAAIAAALVPPIATAGLQLAFWEWEDPIYLLFVYFVSAFVGRISYVSH